MELFRAPQRAAQRNALAEPEVAADAQVLEAALATLPRPAAAGQQTAAVSRAGLADVLGWPLPRLAAAIADLDDTLADRGVRLDVDVVADGRAVHGVAPRPGLLTTAQREALHRLTYADEARPSTSTLSACSTQPPTPTSAAPSATAPSARTQPSGSSSSDSSAVDTEPATSNSPTTPDTPSCWTASTHSRLRDASCGATVERQCCGATELAAGSHGGVAARNRHIVREFTNQLVAPVKSGGAGRGARP